MIWEIYVYFKFERIIIESKTKTLNQFKIKNAGGMKCNKQIYNS
jgi:hypothetical protein